MGLADEDTSVAAWYARLNRLLKDTMVDKYSLFGATRGSTGLVEALNHFATVHRLSLLAKCWPAKTTKDFLLSDNFLGRNYKDANHVLLGRLKESTALSAADLALEAERSFRIGPAEIVTVSGALADMYMGMLADMRGTRPLYKGELVAVAPPIDGQKAWSSRALPEDLIC